MNDTNMGAVILTERARKVYQELEARAREIRMEAQRAMEKLDLRDEERAEVVVALANLEWGMARDAIEAAVGVEREEARLRADVTATALLAQSGD